MNRISQREARRLRKRVNELESILSSQKSRWAKDWPSSYCIGSVTVNDEIHAIVRTARTMEHAVVVTAMDNNRLGIFAAKVGG